MPALDIKLFPDDPLTLKATPYAGVGPEIPRLFEDMIDTMETFNGVGLAGPQVGISKRIFVTWDPDEEPRCFINPEIVDMEGREEGEEGCLSMPRVYGIVPRATRVRVRALDEYGEPFELDAQDFLARIIQHENDHLDGILFPDRLDIISREAALREWDEVRRQILETPSLRNTGSKRRG